MISPLYNKSKPVLVTGATEFIASWIIWRLLDEGFKVHAITRPDEEPARIDALLQLTDNLSGELHIFKANIVEPDACEEAMQGCGTLFHTSSPFQSRYGDPQSELIKSTLSGISLVLETAKTIPQLRRVILTSSCATMYGDHADFANLPGGKFDESMWNTTSTLQHQTYCYAKTEGEKIAWEIARSQEYWQLITINPGMVVGPHLLGTFTSGTHHIVGQLGNGTCRFGVPKFQIGLLDVRDLAEIHLRAAFIEQAHGRYLVFSRIMSLFEMSAILAEEHGNTHVFGKWEMPVWITTLVGPLMNPLLTRKVALRNMGYPWRADNDRACRELGMKYREIDDSLVEMFQQLIESGAI